MSKLGDAWVLSQQVVTVAKEETSRWGHPRVDVDHLFLALIVSGNSAGTVLRRLGVSLDEARAAVEAVHADQVASLGITVPWVRPGPIVDPSIGEIDWTDRALNVLRGVESYFDDLELLRALLDEPSGLVEALVRCLGLDPDDVRRAARQFEAAAPEPPVPAGRLSDPDWRTVVHRGFVPASVAETWRLVADPERRPEWDWFAGRVEPAGPDAWDVWAAPRRPDGKPVKVRPDVRRTRLHVIVAEPGTHVVEWEFSWPDSRRRSGTRRQCVRLTPTDGGTAIELMSLWRRGRGWRRDIATVLAPLRRFHLRQQLITQAAGISRAFR